MEKRNTIAWYQIGINTRHSLIYSKLVSMIINGISCFYSFGKVLCSTVVLRFSGNEFQYLGPWWMKLFDINAVRLVCTKNWDCVRVL